MSDFNLTFTQLKEKAGIKNNELSNNSIHRWIQFGLIASKNNYHSLYSNKSIEQLKLCLKLRAYGKNIYEMKLLLDNYPLKTLIAKVGKITPDELNILLKKVVNSKK